MDDSRAIGESLKHRADVIREQARQAVARHKINEIKDQIQSLEIEMKLWENAYAHSQFKIDALNEIIRVGGI